MGIRRDPNGDDAKQKMAITGVGLVAAGIGLTAVGAVLIVPAVLAINRKGGGKGGQAPNQ